MLAQPTLSTTPILLEHNIGAKSFSYKLSVMIILHEGS